MHIIEHKKHLKESRDILVQFCEHTPIRRVGRLTCTLSSTEQLKESRETLVQFGEHKPIKEESGDCGAIWRAHNNKEESGDCGAVWRAQNIWKRVGRLWCKLVSTKHLGEESGDCGAIW